MRRIPLLLLLAACGKGGPKTDSLDTGRPATDSGEVESPADDSDSPTDSPPQDLDGDGWTVQDGDCDDDDATVHPGAAEICDDGKDNDCDGVGDPDTDGDGTFDCDDFCPIQVDINAASGGNGSFVAPFTVVQDGIDAATPLNCYEVEVHPGTYIETIRYNGVPVDVRGVQGPAQTVLDGRGAGSVVTFDAGEDSRSRLYGFTVTGGAAARGGGIYVSEAAPTIEGNVISGNAATGGSNLGGGLYLIRSDARVFDNEVSDNEAGMGGGDDGNDGGGVAILYGAPEIYGNRFLDNSAGDGGGLWVAHGSAHIYQNVFAGNMADDTGNEDANGIYLYGQGGGVDFQSDTASVVFENNVVTNNWASSHGGGVGIIGFYESSAVANPVVRYNVVAFNDVDAGGYGDGLVVWGQSAPTLSGNLVFDNDGHGIYSQLTSVGLSYSNVTANTQNYAGVLTNLTGSSGNISVDPGVVGVSDDGVWDNDDWHLVSGSGMRDAGDPADTDADGTRADVGAYGGVNGGW